MAKCLLIFCKDSKLRINWHYIIPNDLKSEISSKTGDKPSVENDTEYIHNKKEISHLQFFQKKCQIAFMEHNFS